MTEYTIAAIPTMHNGRQYRSRLEAKWAAFFDLVQWKFEYEPYDLGKWSPDFLLHGAKSPILCEVKPLSSWDSDVAFKMTRAANTACFGGELLLLGLSPVVPGFDSFSWLGWLNDGRNPYFGDGSEGYYYQISDFAPCGCVLSADGRYDFCHSVNFYKGRITGAYDGDHYLVGDSNMASLSEMWARASNSVQWRPTP